MNLCKIIMNLMLMYISEKLVNEFEMMSESYKKKIKELEFENKELKMIEVKD
jgi:hypothetical protein